MHLLLKCLITVELFAISTNCKAQIYNSIKIDLSTRNIHLKNIHYVPFNKVIVLDNRYDTSKIYLFETGQYPLATVSLKEPTSLAIENYIIKAIDPISKGNKTLLVNVRELYIPNRGIYVKKKIVRSGPQAINYYYSRSYLRFYSDIYIQSGENTYKKIADLQLTYFMIPTAEIGGDEIRFLLNELVRCTSIPNENIADSNNTGKVKSYWAKDSIGYYFSNDTSSYSENMINVSANTRWKQMAIISSDLSRDGVYENFQDFQSDKFSQSRKIVLDFHANDSLYRMNVSDSSEFAKSGMPWAICSGKQLYIHLWGNVFQKLTRMDNTFSFYIPYTLPDIYTILSLYENHRQRVSSPVLTANFMVDLGAFAASTVANAAVKESKAKKINEKDKEHDFRICVINMDSGDFIFY